MGSFTKRLISFVLAFTLIMSSYSSADATANVLKVKLRTIALVTYCDDSQDHLAYDSKLKYVTNKRTTESFAAEWEQRGVHDKDYHKIEKVQVSVTNFFKYHSKCSITKITIVDEDWVEHVYKVKGSKTGSTKKNLTITANIEDGLEVTGVVAISFGVTPKTPCYWR